MYKLLQTITTQNIPQSQLQINDQMSDSELLDPPPLPPPLHDTFLSLEDLINQTSLPYVTSSPQFEPTSVTYQTCTSSHTSSPSQLPQSPFSISNIDVVKLRNKSYSRKNFCALLARELFRIEDIKRSGEKSTRYNKNR